MKTAVIYSRVSSPGERQSPERQIIDLKRYAEQNGYEVIQIFSEKISGAKKNQERAVLLECMDFCITHAIDTVLVTEVSRLGRNTLEILKVLEVLHNGEINVFIQNLNINTLLPDRQVNPLFSIVTTLLAEVSVIELRGIANRLNSGREAYKSKGGKLGRKKGSCKTTEKKQEEYREVISYLRKGYSIRNVAKLTDVSVSTVQRIKKEFTK